MARKDFDTTDYHGGALTVPEKPKRLRYPCFADGCPMPGTIFTNGVDKPGVCAWHYGVVGPDVPKVTRILADWACLAYEVREARRAFTDPDIAAKPAALEERFATAWERLKPLVPGWEDQLAPSTIKHRDADGHRTVDSGMRESYSDWAKRLETFLGGKVVETLGVRAPRRTAHSARAHAFAEGTA